MKTVAAYFDLGVRKIQSVVVRRLLIYSAQSVQKECGDFIIHSE